VLPQTIKGKDMWVAVVYFLGVNQGTIRGESGVTHQALKKKGGETERGGETRCAKKRGRQKKSRW